MSPLQQIVYMLFVGTLCQIIGWRIKMPSILLLLLAGVLSGPVLHLLTPDQVLGPVRDPAIELAVAVILFEGGLSLKKRELGEIGRTVMKIISIGTLVTWVALAVASYVILGLGLRVSALLGSILVISGPTVVVPLLRSIRARAPVEPILRWEGILIDPIGVALAVLVAETFEWQMGVLAPWHIVSGICTTVAVGVLLGALGAIILKYFVGRHAVPDQFIVPLCLAVLFALVFLSNLLHEQSGLLTATIMGVFLASSKKAWVQTIEDFIGHTQCIFIGMLFMILSARLDARYLQHLDGSLILFVAVAVVIVRPLAILAATTGATLTLRERLALSCLAPRGIVSAALASSLGASLLHKGIPGVDYIVPYTFATIMGTVFIYGSLSPRLFSMLGVTQQATEGILFVGAGPIALSIGSLLQKAGFKVAYVDTNGLQVTQARSRGLRAYHGSILSEGLQEDLDLEGIGKLLAFTSNDEANSLATVEFSNLFGSASVFRVALQPTDNTRIAGRFFGEKTLTLSKMDELWLKGYRPLLRPVMYSEKGDRIYEDSVEEYLLAEIEGNNLFLASHDNLRRPTKPTQEIVYGLPNSSSSVAS